MSFASEPNTTEIDCENDFILPRTAREPDEIRDELLDPLVTLTISTHQPLQTKHIEFVPLLPSYPSTHPKGFTYVIDVRNSESWEDVIEHQYCRLRTCPPKDAKSLFLSTDIASAVEGKLYRFQCSGIKRCEYLDPTFRDVSHTHVTPESLEQVRRLVQRYPDASDPDIRKRNAAKKYFAINERFSKGISCREQLPTCRPVLGEFENVSNLYQIRDRFVKCRHYLSSSVGSHFFKVFRGTEPIDWDYFRGYYQGLEIVESTCYRVEPTTTRLGNCGVPHPQGPGQLEHQACEVKFRYFVPRDTNSTPFVHFSSHGIHTHPHPPPTRTPEKYIADLQRLIRMADASELTFVRFQTSPILQEYLRTQNVDSLGQLHESLNNAGRIAWEIHRQRLLLYPDGTDIAGVMFQFQQEQRKPDADRFLQGIWNDTNGVMIICFYQQAAEILLQQPDLEVDMSFKRIKHANMNEILFARFLEEHDRIFTFARIIVSTDTTATYRLAFQRFFELVSQRTGKGVFWFHLHKKGFRAIIVDMLLKQARGIAEYLQEIDSLHREWHWQLEHIICYCTVHLARSISRAAGTQLVQGSGHSEMYSLITATTKERFLEVMRELKLHPKPKVRDWARHKEQQPIRCGLFSFFSAIDLDYWQRLRTTSNAVEQAANKGYASGIRMSLLPAITKASIRDRADYELWIARECSGIRTQWRSSSAIQRASRDLQRAGSPFAPRIASSSHSSSEPRLTPEGTQLMPPPLPPSTRATSRKRSARSGSSVSDTNDARSADVSARLQQRSLELDVQAKELANRELTQRLDREALEFEREQRRFRKEIEEEDKV